MSESGINYIGSDELVFNNDTDLGIHSGGFSVNSIMLKAGMSPIMTVNSDQLGGTNEKVSDLFNNLVIPNWTLSYNNRLTGGKYNEIKKKINDTEDDIIDDDLHEKLLDLVKQHEIKAQKAKSNKRVTKRIKNKNAGTKRRQ
jgi:hypothetical protein